MARKKASGVLRECLYALVSMSECAHSALCSYYFYITSAQMLPNVTN